MMVIKTIRETSSIYFYKRGKRRATPLSRARTKSSHIYFARDVNSVTV